jgi:hypothetical protein
MTTLVLQAADTAIGGLVGAGTNYLGSLLAGAITGSGGRSTTRSVEGPRLTEMNGLASTEGAPIPRVYGRARIGGQLIWATRFEEVANTVVDRQTSRGGKSLGPQKRTATTTTTTYAYQANLAVGLCEGPIAFVRRIWADGREIDQTTLTIRVHPGTEDQPPDPLIVAKEGAENAPAYRGLAYVVFEKLPLAEFGNRVPQFTFEVVRPVDGLRQMIRSVCLIPAAGEFAYETIPTRRDLGLGRSAPENTHQLWRTNDVTASLDQLQALCPNLAHVSLVVSWFGDDLRAGQCTIAPRVETSDKSTTGTQWSVAGLSRITAREVSRVAGRPAYGGTPSDESVVRLIQALRARGLAVTLYPFVMMDIPAGNELPDPRTGGIGQPPIPGGAASPAIPRLAGSAGQTDRRGADQVAAFVRRDGRLGSAPPRPPLRRSRRLGRRRRCLHHRFGTRRPDRACAPLPACIRPWITCARWRARCAENSGPRPASPMRRTGPSTAPMCLMAARRCASRSTRSGPIRPSMRSASTITRRSPTGAMGR